MSLLITGAHARLMLILGVVSGGLAHAQTPAKISRFGVYRGYSAPRYDGWVRSSQYVTVRDSTRLAIDIFRPAKQGKVEAGPLPVIWTHTPYYRSNIAGGKLATILDDLPWVETVLRHGYVAAAVDVRGTGASYGAVDGVFQPAEARDAYDVTEWLARQPWSTGKIGMYGLSYLGITQLFAASEAPPHLKAIIPEMAWFDAYDFIYPGGIYQYWSLFNWSTGTKRNNIQVLLPPDWREILVRGSSSQPARVASAGCTYLPCAPMGGGPVSPVDADRDGSLLAGAVSQHLFRGSDVYTTYATLRYRNSVESPPGRMQYLERSIYPRKAAIERSGVAIYHVAGWYDGFTRDGILAYHNLRTPRRLTIGPWFHPEIQGYDKAAEALRWFDYWLTGVANGVMDEEPIHYWVLDAPAGREWRAARQWPLPSQRATDYYLLSGPSQSVRSANDGRLAPVRPAGAAERDDYTIDYSATLGISNRWTATAGGAPGPVRDYPDLAAHDRNGLTYTTPPLAEAIEVTGHPVVHLWLSTTARNVDVHAVLEEVWPNGKSDYVTEGRLRASHRALGPAPYDNFGLPYHRSHVEDVRPLPDRPVELVFDLLPTSKLFRAGYRIRVTLTGADHTGFATPVLLPPPKLAVHRSAQYPSRISLPVVGAGRE